MKQIMKKISAVLLALCMSAGMAVTALANEGNKDSVVTFQNDRLIVFAPGSEFSDTDLFDNFKGVMPGDERSEEITIENQCGRYDYIRVYMKAVPHDTDGNPISDEVLAELLKDKRMGKQTAVHYMLDFLAQLELEVKQGERVIFDDKADQTGGLTDYVYLGAYDYNESTELDVTLYVPLEMGNEYANRIGEVDWQFLVEGINVPDEDDDDDDDEKPKKPEKPARPQDPDTSDRTVIWPYILLMLLCVIALAADTIRKRQKRKNSNN